MVILMDRSTRITKIEESNIKKEKQRIKRETMGMQLEDKSSRKKTQKRKSISQLGEEEIMKQAADKFYKKESERILGMLIIQYGECENLPEAISVKLICASKIKEEGIRSAENLGTILLGFYLYSLKEMYEDGYNIYPYGILELVNGYKNPVGYCAYSKFGFVHDPSIELGICYKSLDLLPMSVDITRTAFTPENIFDVVNGNENRIATNVPVLCREDFKNIALDSPIRTNLRLLYEICDFFEMLMAEKRSVTKENPRIAGGLTFSQFHILKQLLANHTMTARLNKKMIERTHDALLSLSLLEMASIYSLLKKKIKEM
jgi:hypothetical protein